MSLSYDRHQLLTRIRESLGGLPSFERLDEVGAQLSGLGRSIVSDIEYEFAEAISRQESSAA